MTNTITIDPGIYAEAKDYAKKHDLNIAHLVEEYLMKLITGGDQTSEKEPSDDYEISPKIKALMVGFKCDESLPYDYKNEFRKYKADKYL